MSVTPIRAGIVPPSTALDADELACLSALERKILWLASWMIHNANHLRPKRDGLKVGGHQASCASMVQIMTALYFHVLKPEDRVAVKPHASPVFHAIQYLLGHQEREPLEKFRALGGVQAYPSRTKDNDDVDFSTGSVGLGVAMTSFSALVQDYLAMKEMLPKGVEPGRMIALVGDAELDEGNIYEALLESWKHQIRNVWWIIDYNRQSLDSVVSDELFGRIEGFFEAVGWEITILKYGKKQEAAFAQPGGEALRDWIADCPNDLYSALCFKGGAAWREHLNDVFKPKTATAKLIAQYDDEGLHALMTNLAGHDLETLIEAFDAVDDDRPRCFLAYTIKGNGLPLAGHKDNHAGLMSPEQMESFRTQMAVPEGEEWDRFAGLDIDGNELQAFLDEVAFAKAFPRRHDAPTIAIPEELVVGGGSSSMSTQEAFGRILNEIARDEDELARHIVTTSPDVTVSTNLGPWVNRRHLFDRRDRDDVFRKENVMSAQTWTKSQKGQHIELGIAENNLFILLASLGLSHSLFGTRLLPVGTLYDPFIARGLDALNYACYQDARFMLVATPSGISLSPEGGAHQSVMTPLIGIGQPGLSSFEPAFADELAVMMRWGFVHMQEADGGSVYLRLSTRPIEQIAREMTGRLAADILAGGYWLVEPAPDTEIAVVCSGAVTPEALAAVEALREDIPGVGLLAVTSADRLMAEWHGARRQRRAGHNPGVSHVETLLSRLPAHAGLITVLDGHPATLSWMAGVGRHKTQSLGVETFGQSADIIDLYRVAGIDTDAIVDAAARLCLTA